MNNSIIDLRNSKCDVSTVASESIQILSMLFKYVNSVVLSSFVKLLHYFKLRKTFIDWNILLDKLINSTYETSADFYYRIKAFS